MRVKIYAIQDRDGKTVYVGATKQPLPARLSFHFKYADRHPHRPLCQWLPLNKDCSISLIEEVDFPEWRDAERRWIAHFGLGNLLNTYVGGNGQVGARKDAVRKACVRAGVDYQEFVSRLGTKSDHLLGKEIGLSRSAIARFRNKLGVSASREVRFPDGLPPEVIEDLSLPSHVVSKKHGFSTELLAYYRRKHSVSPPPRPRNANGTFATNVDIV